MQEAGNIPFFPTKSAFQHCKPQLNSFQLCCCSFCYTFFQSFSSTGCSPLYWKEWPLTFSYESHVQPMVRIEYTAASLKRLKQNQLDWVGSGRSFLEIISSAWAFFSEQGYEDVVLMVASQQLRLLLSWGKVTQFVQRPNVIG